MDKPQTPSIGQPSTAMGSPAELLAIFKKQRDAEDAKLRSAKPDVWTGKKVCMCFKIPASFITPKSKVTALDPKAVEVQLNLQMGYTNCLGLTCGNWNAEDKECWNITDKRNKHAIAQHLETLVDLTRIQSAGGGSDN